MESRNNAVTIALKDETALVDVTLLSGEMRFGASFLADAIRVIRKTCAAIGALMAPLSLIAYFFAIWRLADDIGWSGAVVISTGFFSHWIIWLTIGLALSLTASLLKAQAPARS